jgi:hypothetical protein
MPTKTKTKPVKKPVKKTAKKRAGVAVSKGDRVLVMRGMMQKREAERLEDAIHKLSACSYDLHLVERGSRAEAQFARLLIAVGSKCLKAAGVSVPRSGAK